MTSTQTTTTTMTTVNVGVGLVPSMPATVPDAYNVQDFEDLVPIAMGKLGSQRLFQKSQQLPEACGLDGLCHDMALVATVAIGVPVQFLQVRLDSRPQAFSEECLGLWFFQGKQPERPSPEPLKPAWASSGASAVRTQSKVVQSKALNGFVDGNSISVTYSGLIGNGTRYGSSRLNGACLQDSVTIAGTLLKKQRLFLVKSGMAGSSRWAGGLSLDMAAPFQQVVLDKSSDTPSSDRKFLFLVGNDAKRHITSIPAIRWAPFNPDGRLPGTLAGHYVPGVQFVRFEVDLTTTFLLAPGSRVQQLLELLFPKGLQKSCNWDTAHHIIYCKCSVKSAMAPLHVSVDSAHFLLHGEDLLKVAPDDSGQCALRIHATAPDMPQDVFILGGKLLLSKYALAWDLEQKRLGLFKPQGITPQDTGVFDV